MCCLISISWLLVNEVIVISYVYREENIVLIELYDIHFLLSYSKYIIFYYMCFLLLLVMF